MPEPPWLEPMDDPNLKSAPAAQDAAEALIALGWPVTPPNPSQPLWQVYDELLTTTQLLAIASFVAILPRANNSKQ